MDDLMIKTITKEWLKCFDIEKVMNSLSYSVAFRDAFVLVEICDSGILDDAETSVQKKMLAELDKYLSFTESIYKTTETDLIRCVRRFVEYKLVEGKYVYSTLPLTLLNAKFLPDTWVFDEDEDDEAGYKMTDGDVWHVNNLEIMLRTLALCLYRRDATLSWRLNDVVRADIQDFVKSKAVYYSHVMKSNKDDVYVFSNRPMITRYPVVRFY